MAEHEQGNVVEALALLPSRTDTKWFRRLRKYPRVFLDGRLRFNGVDTGAPFPSVVVYFGSSGERFAEVFGSFGELWLP